MRDKNLSEMVFCRVPGGFRKKFTKKAKRHGNPSEVHREILYAFVDGRLTITPSKDKEELFNDNRK